MTAEVRHKELDHRLTGYPFWAALAGDQTASDTAGTNLCRYSSAARKWASWSSPDSPDGS